MSDFENYFIGNQDVKIIGFIYETSNYEMFKKLQGNRDVEKIGSLKTSMKKNGFMNCPILINEKNEITDGQHRFESAKELGIPVKFTVQQEMGLNETIQLNTGQKNWKVEDYIHSYAANGNVNYKRIEQLLQMFPFPGYTICAAIGTSITGGGYSGYVKRGTLVCTEKQYEDACVILEWLSRFNDLAKGIKGSKNHLYVALIFAYKHSDINVSTLTQRVRDNFYIYDGRVTSAEDAVLKTEKVYNFKVPTNNKVYLVDAYRKAVDESLARIHFNKGNSKK